MEVFRPPIASTLTEQVAIDALVRRLSLGAHSARALRGDAFLFNNGQTAKAQTDGREVGPAISRWSFRLF